MKVEKHLIFVLVIFFLAIVGGAFSYYFVEGWNLLDSFYFVVVTVTTIGYGDFVPKSVQGKIFTMFFSFFGVATALYFLSVMSKSIFKEHLGIPIGQIKRSVQLEKAIEKEVRDNVKKAMMKR